MWKDLEILFIVSLIFFFFIFLTPENDRLLANRVGDFLGKISYSLYLLHIPVITSYSIHYTKLYEVIDSIIRVISIIYKTRCNLVTTNNTRIDAIELLVKRIKWFFYLVKTFTRLKPKCSFLIVTLSLITQILRLMSFLVPIKMLFLLGESRSYP